MNMNQMREIISRLGVINTYEAAFEVTLTILIGMLLGLAISYTYKKTYKGFAYSQEFAHNIVIICVIISLIISVIGTNIARAFSLAGALSIIRFRSSVQSPRDIAFIFFSMGAGLACGAGLYIPAIIFVILLSIFIFFIQSIDFVAEKNEAKVLKITMPESMNYENIFNDILTKYVERYTLESVRTVSAGTVFELIYYIKVKSGVSEKEMIDEIRSRNGNFNVALMRNLQENN